MTDDQIQPLTDEIEILSHLTKTFRALFITLFGMYMLLGVIALLFEHQMHHIQKLADTALMAQVTSQNNDHRHSQSRA